MPNYYRPPSSGWRFRPTSRSGRCRLALSIAASITAIVSIRPQLS
jgi:hypothetical protein